MVFCEKRGKKGISPLIATILLIGFTVVLALLVWFWFSGFITERTQKQGEIVEAQISCVTGIDLRIQKACFDQGNNKVQLTIENSANNAVDGFIVRLASEFDPNVDVFDVPVRIEALNVDTLVVSTSTVSNPTSAVIIPRLNIEGGTTSCSEQAISVSLNSC